MDLFISGKFVVGGLMERKVCLRKKKKNGYLAKLGARLQTSRYHFFPQIKGN